MRNDYPRTTEYTPAMENAIKNQGFSLVHAYDKNHTEWLKHRNKLRDGFIANGVEFRTTQTQWQVKLWVKWVLENVV